MKRKLFLLLMTLPIFIASCENDDDLSSAKNERKHIVLTRSQKELANENVKFAFSLFNKVNEQETEHPNWIMSPFSASIAMSITANGAEGNSRTQIQNALGFNGFQMDEINDYYKLLTKELLAVDKTTQLSLANSVWLHNNFKFHDSFVNTTKKMYEAKVTTLDLTDQSALKKINDWSADHTNNLIPIILEELPDNLKFCILNSLYFKGVWLDEFEKSSTVDGLFTCANGQQNQVKMMRQVTEQRYCSNEYFALAEFPYGNGAFSMMVLLPNEGCTLEESFQNFNANDWIETTESGSLEMFLCELNVSFPRFELKYETNLIEAMQSLGITDIFDENKADFSNLSSSNVFINLLKQSAYLKVDEKGAEAAATTIVGGMDASPGPLYRKADFHMNRPFAFIIKENSTGTILFMGKVTEL